MNHEYEIRSQVDLVSTPHEIVPEQTRHEEELVAHEIRENPVPSSHNLQNALPAIPGVVQDNNGLIHVAGGRVEDTVRNDKFLPFLGFRARHASGQLVSANDVFRAHSQRTIVVLRSFDPAA